jgi:RNA polymerase sigma factor (TIGR02999 family)
MDAVPNSDITTVLEEMHAGNPDAQSRLLSLAYDELRRMAAGFMHGERAGHTWQPTDLANEAVARLLGGPLPTENRSQFFAAAAEAMRRLLIEHARRRNAQKRKGDGQRVPLDDVADYFERQQLDVIALHEALAELATRHPRQSQVVTLRFFGGYGAEEVAAMLAVSLSTVEADFRHARAWLYGELVGTRS